VHQSGNDLPDLSIIVTAHAEGRLIRPTLRSIGLASAELGAMGRRVEIIVVLDNATAGTREQAEAWRGDANATATIRLLDTVYGEPAGTRNAGAKAAKGRYVAFCDGDDLVSRHYFADALAMLEKSADPRIVHPAVVVSFGVRTAVWNVEGFETANYLDLLRDNLWPSSSMSQKSTYLEHPYVTLRAEDGFGPEDWLWNIQTAIAGIPHSPVEGSMFFYRVKGNSGVNHGHRHSILPDFDLDGLRHAMPIRDSHTRSTGTRRVESVVRRSYGTVRPLIRLLGSRLSIETKQRMVEWARRRYRAATRPHFRLDPAVVNLLREASELEPAISWPATKYLDLPRWRTRHDAYAPTLVSIVDSLRDASDALVLVPWVGIGGADLVSLNYARALAATERFHGRVSMLATYRPERTVGELVPQGVGFHQMDPAWRTLSPNLQKRLLAQALVLLQPKVVVSVNCFDMTNSLQSYARQLASTSQIFLTLFAFDRIGNGYPVNPITDDAERDFLDEIHGILTDNTVTRRLVEEILGMADDRVAVHHQPALPTTPDLRTNTRAFNDSAFNASDPFRLIWPHRLDHEKRPDALIGIAEEARRRGLPIRIEVHGQKVLSEKSDLLRRMGKVGIVYRGPYSGGLAALATQDYHALLLTSESEGLPLVLVQSMLLGLPVIATNVGGVTDIVRNGETGLLVSGPDDTVGFVDAIQALSEKRDLRRHLVRAGYALAVEQHGWAAFERQVADGLAEVPPE